MRFKYGSHIVVTAASESEARGLLGKAQDLLEENGMLLVIEDGVPVIEEEEEDNGTSQSPA